jgi:hypothetical protein
MKNSKKGEYHPVKTLPDYQSTGLPTTATSGWQILYTLVNEQ